MGAIFRSAAAFGVDQIWLVGITAEPPRAEISKVALGGDEIVPWRTATWAEAFAYFKENHYTITALETGSNSPPSIETISDPNRLALLIGNEVSGIEPEILTAVDQIVEIPMAQKRSLNVSVATGIALYARRVRS